MIAADITIVISRYRSAKVVQVLPAELLNSGGVCFFSARKINPVECSCGARVYPSLAVPSYN